MKFDLSRFVLLVASTMNVNEVYARKDYQIPRISASDVAGITGYNPWTSLIDIWQKYLYQDLLDLLHIDASNIGADVVTKEEEIKRLQSNLLVKDSIEIEETVKTFIESGGSSANDLHDCTEKLKSLLAKDSITTRLTTEDIQTLLLEFLGEVRMTYGNKNEEGILDIYEKVTNRKVSNRNDRYLIWPIYLNENNSLQYENQLVEKFYRVSFREHEYQLRGGLMNPFHPLNPTIQPIQEIVKPEVQEGSIAAASDVAPRDPATIENTTRNDVNSLIPACDRNGNCNGYGGSNGCVDSHRYGNNSALDYIESNNISGNQYVHTKTSEEKRKDFPRKRGSSVLNQEVTDDKGLKQLRKKEIVINTGIDDGSISARKIQRSAVQMPPRSPESKTYHVNNVIDLLDDDDPVDVEVEVEGSAVNLPLRSPSAQCRNNDCMQSIPDQSQPSEGDSRAIEVNIDDEDGMLGTQQSSHTLSSTALHSIIPEHHQLQHSSIEKVEEDEDDVILDHDPPLFYIIGKIDGLSFSSSSSHSTSNDNLPGSTPLAYAQNTFINTRNDRPGLIPSTTPQTQPSEHINLSSHKEHTIVPMEPPWPHSGSHAQPPPVVVEVKNRTRAIAASPPLQDQIQLCTYMFMLKLKQGDLVEAMKRSSAQSVGNGTRPYRNVCNENNLNSDFASSDMTNTSGVVYHSNILGSLNAYSRLNAYEPMTADLGDVSLKISRIALSGPPYFHDDNWRTCILPRIRTFVQGIKEMRRDDGARYQWLIADDAEKRRIIIQLCPDFEYCDLK